MRIKPVFVCAKRECAQTGHAGNNGGVCDAHGGRAAVHTPVLTFGTSTTAAFQPISTDSQKRSYGWPAAQQKRLTRTETLAWAMPAAQRNSRSVEADGCESAGCTASLESV